MEEKKLIENLRICSKTYHVHCGVTCSNKVCGSCRNILMAEAVDLINSKNETITEYEQKLEDGELVSKDWHDEQVMHFAEENETLKAELKKELAEHEKFTKKANDKIEYYKDREKSFVNAIEKKNKYIAYLQRKLRGTGETFRTEF